MGKKIGAPIKINETSESVAIALAEKGHIDREIAEIIGVSESALNEHKKRKPDFKKLLLEAKSGHDKEVVESALLARALGSLTKETQTKITSDGKKTVTVIERILPPEPSCISLFLKNRDPEKWCKEKQTVQINHFEHLKHMTVAEARKILLEEDPFGPTD